MERDHEQIERPAMTQAKCSECNTDWIEVIGDETYCPICGKFLCGTDNKSTRLSKKRPKNGLIWFGENLDVENRVMWWFLWVCSWVVAADIFVSAFVTVFRILKFLFFAP